MQTYACTLKIITYGTYMVWICTNIFLLFTTRTCLNMFEHVPPLFETYLFKHVQTCWNMGMGCRYPVTAGSLYDDDDDEEDNDSENTYLNMFKQVLNIHV